MVSVEHYIKELLGEKAVLSHERDKRLPGFLNASYDIRACKYAGGTFYLMIERDGEPRSIASIEKQSAWLQELRQAPVAFVTKAMPNYKISRMTKKRIPFIIPGVRAFLPFVGIINTPVRSVRPKSIPTGIGYKSQRVLIAYLNKCFEGMPTIPSVCRFLDCSRVTATKVFDEIEATGLAKRTPLPASHQIGLAFMVKGKMLWEKIEPRLNSPIRALVHLDNLPENSAVVHSGESALADCTMLGHPEVIHLAQYITGNAYSKLKAKAVPPEEATVIVEVWRYPPLLPGRNKLDSLSIWLTTRGIADDERVQGEREEMMEAFQW